MTRRLLVQDLDSEFGAVGYRQPCLLFQLGWHLVNEDPGLTLVIHVEELGSQPVATGMALELVGINTDLHPNTTGNSLGPRTWPPAQVIFASLASENSGMRSSHSCRAIRNSIRARFDPAQRWIPDPNATCRL